MTFLGAVSVGANDRGGCGLPVDGAARSVQSAAALLPMRACAVLLPHPQRPGGALPSTTLTQADARLGACCVSIQETIESQAPCGHAAIRGRFAIRA